MTSTESDNTQTRMIVHDVNNCLGTIIGLAELVLEEIQPADTFREDIESILENAVKASDLASSLLSVDAASDNKA